MDRPERLREQIISTYWEIHHERSCGRCDDLEPGAKDGEGEGEGDGDPAGPGPADRSL